MPTPSLADAGRFPLFAHLDALQRLLGLASKLTDAPRATLSRVHPAAGVETIAAIWAEGFPRDLPCIDESAARAGAPLLIADLAHDARFAGHPEWLERGVRAYAGVPILAAESQTIGVLAVRDCAPRRWGAETVALLGELAWLAARELERADDAPPTAPALAA